jgi:hypothetical protein
MLCNEQSYITKIVSLQQTGLSSGQRTMLTGKESLGPDGSDLEASVGHGQLRQVKAPWH